MTGDAAQSARPRSARSPQSQRLSGAERRGQLLDVARGCFTEMGYQRTTTAIVADRAGVSETLVIKHFRSKEELFRSAIADPVLQVIRAQVEENRPLEETGLDALVGYQRTSDFIRRLVAVMRSEQGIFRAVASTMYEFPNLIEEIRDLVASNIETLAKSLEDLGDPQPFRPHSARTATFTVVGGAIVAAAFHDDPDTFADELTEMLFFGNLSPEGRRTLHAKLGR
jgi:AcrR family transcriptional regulator